MNLPAVGMMPKSGLTLKEDAWVSTTCLTLFGLLTEERQTVFNHHFEDMRSFVKGWPNPHQKLIEFLK